MELYKNRFSFMSMRSLLFISYAAVMFNLCNDAQAAHTSIPNVSTTPGSTYICQKQTCKGLEKADVSLEASIYPCESSTDICYSTRSGGGGVTSTVYRATSCTSCPSGTTAYTVTADSMSVKGCTVTYKLCKKSQTIKVCPSKCPSESWSDDASQTGRQIRCNRAEQKCEYKCKRGYYNTATGSSTTCHTCPSNGSCLNGFSVCCNSGYYSETEQRYVDVGGWFQQQNITTCERCPELENFYGKTSRLCANSITQCYIPANTAINATEGSYEFTSDCNYSEFTIVDPDPIQPGN